MQFPTASSAFGTVTVLLDLSHSRPVWRYLPWLLLRVPNSPEVSVRHLFPGLCALCTSSRGKCLFMSSAHVLMGFFLMLSFNSSLYILNVLFVWLVICKDFLPLCSLYFNPLTTAFPRTEVWNFDGSNISIFRLSCFLVFYLRSCLLVLGLQDFLLYITRKVL